MTAQPCGEDETTEAPPEQAADASLSPASTDAPAVDLEVHSVLHSAITTEV